MNQDKVKFICIVSLTLLIFLSVIQTSEAIGIRPAKSEINFNENKNFSGSFWVINNDNRNINLKISLEEEMSEHIELETKELNFRDDESSKEVLFNVILPDEVPAGESYATIKVEETLTSQDSNIITSKIIVKHKIKIIGPYPERYIEAKLNINEINDEFSIVAEIENLGEEDIEKIKTSFFINNQETTIKGINFEDQSLQQGENKIISNSINKEDLGEGEFEIIGKIDYDNNTIEIVKELTNGIPEIEITYFNQFLISGIINLYSMELFNNWNKNLENVFVEASIKENKGQNSNQTDQEIDSFRTKSIDIGTSEREIIQDYYDASKIKEGEYILELVVNYWNNYKMDSQEFKVKFLENNESNSVLTGMITANEKKSDSFITGTFFKTVGIISLIIIIITITSIMIARLKKRDDEW